MQESLSGFWFFLNICVQVSDINLLCCISAKKKRIICYLVCAFYSMRIYSGQQTRTFIEAVEQYAQLGLRTLCLAWRELDEDEYQDWSLVFKEASSTLVDREVRRKGLTFVLFIIYNIIIWSTVPKMAFWYIATLAHWHIWVPSNHLFLQWRIAEACQRLEHDLEVLGVTAIEDRLQVRLQ